MTSLPRTHSVRWFTSDAYRFLVTTARATRARWSCACRRSHEPHAPAAGLPVRYIPAFLLPLIVFSVVGDTRHVARASGATPSQAQLVVSGIVFEDRNGDGKKAGQDPVLQGWAISLLSAEEFGFPTNTAVTDSAGRYRLTLPVTPEVATAYQLFVIASPPSPEPQGQRWVTTAVSTRFAGIPDANLLRGPFGQGLTQEANFGQRLEQGTRPRKIRPFDYSPSDLLRQPEVAAHPPRPVGNVEQPNTAPGAAAPSSTAETGTTLPILALRLCGGVALALGVLAGLWALASRRTLRRRISAGATGAALLVVGVLLSFAVGVSVQTARAAVRNNDGLAAPLYRPAVVKNDTVSYGSEVGSAIAAWNSTYLAGWGGSGTIDLWVVTYGSFADYYLSSVTGMPTCVQEAQTYPWLLAYKAWEANYFEQSWGFMQKGHVCLYPPVGPSTTLGFEHEFGHGLYLGHDTEGVMNTCWCNPISSTERNLLVEIYER